MGRGFSQEDLQGRKEGCGCGWGLTGGHASQYSLSSFGDVPEHSVTSEECEDSNTDQVLQSSEHVLCNECHVTSTSHDFGNTSNNPSYQLRPKQVIETQNG